MSRSREGGYPAGDKKASDMKPLSDIPSEYGQEMLGAVVPPPLDVVPPSPPSGGRVFQGEGYRGGKPAEEVRPPTDYPSQFTQPQLININELKRLLEEIVYELVDAMPAGTLIRDALKRRLWHIIERAILDGDDS